MLAIAGAQQGGPAFSGLIDLNGDDTTRVGHIIVEHPNITIAGQTAHWWLLNKK